MATLYVQNVPDELYEALRRQAKLHRKSIAAEVVALLHLNVAAEKELKLRQDFLQRVRKLQSRRAQPNQPFRSTEEMQREDRER